LPDLVACRVISLLYCRTCSIGVYPNATGRPSAFVKISAASGIVRDAACDGNDGGAGVRCQLHRIGAHSAGATMDQDRLSLLLRLRNRNRRRTPRDIAGVPNPPAVQQAIDDAR
jgi:hypothetical protein